MHVLPKKQNFVFFFLTMMLALGAISCDHNKLYEENQNIENSSWSSNTPVRFTILVKDTTDLCNVLLNIRNERNYPYRNLYLFVRVTSPAGYYITDTLDIELADKKGKWYGSGLGDLYYLQVPYRTSVRFPLTGIYTFEISQGMRNDVLKGIRNIGIRMEKVKPQNSGKKK